jgi:hypothetical protein
VNDEKDPVVELKDDPFAETSQRRDRRAVRG